MPAENSDPLLISIQGSLASQRLELSLPVGVLTRVGRQPQSGWSVPWDKMISREHADFLWDGERLQIDVTENARNPVVHHSKQVRTVRIEPGDWFQIGQTTFQTRWLTEPADGSQPLEATTSFLMSTKDGYTPAELRKYQFENAAQQLELLSELPEGLRKATTDQELCSTLSRLLLAALPQAVAVAVSHYDISDLPSDPYLLTDFPKPLTMRVELRDDYSGRFQPSRRMIWQALVNERSLIHISSGGDNPDSGITLSEGLGWSFCCPVRGVATKGWCLYVSGRGSRSGSLVISEADLVPDLRFTELVAQFIGSIRQIRLLQEQKTQLSTFFSPKVIESLNDSRRSTELLCPAERSISVLFCDVRGFSRKSEKLQGDLLRLLDSVSAALGVMAKGIQDNDGTIADFQGDAALGFWGWPVPLDEGPIPACRAALQIFNEFRVGTVKPGDLLEGFSVGIGIAHGRAVAGQIGTERQAKVGVLGPVVNLGSRLEGLSKQFGVPICVDENTAVYVKDIFSPGEITLRRLALVRPKGMDTAITVYGLIPASCPALQLSPALLQQANKALDQIVSGDWHSARQILSCFPETDTPTQQLLKLMANTEFQPPPNWDGAFAFDLK